MAWSIGAYEVADNGATVSLSGQSVTASIGTVTVSTGITGADVPLAGQTAAVSVGSVTVSTGDAAWQVTDVDLDETVTDGQTGVVVTITGTVAATGKLVFIEQGGDWVEQTVTGETAQTITITVSYGGILSNGAANLYVRNPL